MKNLSKHLILLLLAVVILSSCYRNGNYNGPRYRSRASHYHPRMHTTGHFKGDMY